MYRNSKYGLGGIACKLLRDWEIEVVIVKGPMGRGCVECGAAKIKPNRKDAKLWIGMPLERRVLP